MPAKQGRTTAGRIAVEQIAKKLKKFFRKNLRSQYQDQRPDQIIENFLKLMHSNCKKSAIDSARY
jgi:DNA topoisomerase VI subunit B